jgi:hypothetical protein
MKSSIKVLLVFISVLAGIIVTGCTTKTAKDTSIPWSRPADWEGQVPGMGDMGSSNRR